MFAGERHDSSAAKAPYSKVRRKLRPQHTTLSPAFADSGRTMMPSHLGHDTLYASAALQPPSCSLSRRECPAQFGQSIRSPDRARGGTERTAPQSGHVTLGIDSQPQQPLQLASVISHDNLVADHDHRHGHAACPGDQLGASVLVLRDVSGFERHTSLRKKLFRCLTRASRRRPEHGDPAIAHDSPFTVLECSLATAQRLPPRRSRTPPRASQRSWNHQGSPIPHRRRGLAEQEPSHNPDRARRGLQQGRCFDMARRTATWRDSPSH